MKQCAAAISVGSQSRLFCGLFCNTVTKWSPLSVSSALQKPGLASDVYVTGFISPFVSAIIGKVQKLPVNSAALGGLKCCNYSIGFALHVNKLPTACVTPRE